DSVLGVGFLFFAVENFVARVKNGRKDLGAAEINPDNQIAPRHSRSRFDGENLGDLRLELARQRLDRAVPIDDLKAEMLMKTAKLKLNLPLIPDKTLEDVLRHA